MKRYFSRVVALFTNRKIWVRQSVVASLAAGAAWVVGGPITEKDRGKKVM